MKGTRSILGGLRRCGTGVAELGYCPICTAAQYAHPANNSRVRHQPRHDNRS